MDISAIVHTLASNNWVQLWALILGVLISVDQLLSFVAPLTPWTWDDRVVAVLGKLLAKVVKKK